MADGGDIHLYTPEELMQELYGHSEPVEFKEGVFQVSDAVLDSGQTKPDSNSELSELVDALTIDNEVSGIDALYASAVPNQEIPLDFFPEDTPDETEEEPRRKQKRLLLVKEGINFDAYVAGGKQSSLKELRALTKVSHSLNALTAAILVRGEEGLYVEHGIGFEETDTGVFCLSYSSSLYEVVFHKRYFLCVNVKTTGIPALDTIFKDESTRYSNSSLYLPIVFRGEPAYLFLGLKEPDIDIISGLQRILRF